LLLHVVDAADPLREERVQQVREVLADIGAQRVPELLVMNKMDLLSDDPTESISLTLVGDATPCFPVSAVSGLGIAALVDGMADALGVAAPHEVILDVADGRTRAWLYRAGAVLGETVAEDGRLHLTLQADAVLLAQLQRLPEVVLRRQDAVPKLSMVAN